MMRNYAEIGVVIPQFGRSDLTGICLNSLQQFLPELTTEVILVDDGSSPTERRNLQKLYDCCSTIVPSNANRGVTSAWNLGWKASRAEFIIFLNNDAVSHGPWLSQLVAPLQANQGLISGIQWRREIDLPLAVQHLCTNAEVLAGWCFAIKRSLLEQLGGFDEQMRMYYSDTDLQCRLLREFPSDSETLVVVNDLPLSHGRHQTTRTQRSRRKYWMNDRSYFQRKWAAHDVQSERS